MVLEVIAHVCPCVQQLDETGEHTPTLTRAVVMYLYKNKYTGDRISNFQSLIMFDMLLNFWQRSQQIDCKWWWIISLLTNIFALWRVGLSKIICIEQVEDQPVLINFDPTKVPDRVDYCFFCGEGGSVLSTVTSNLDFYFWIHLPYDISVPCRK